MPSFWFTFGLLLLSIWLSQAEFLLLKLLRSLCRATKHFQTHLRKRRTSKCCSPNWQVRVAVRFEPNWISLFSGHKRLNLRDRNFALNWPWSYLDHKPFLTSKSLPNQRVCTIKLRAAKQVAPSKSHPANQTRQSTVNGHNKTFYLDYICLLKLTTN